MGARLQIQGGQYQNDTAFGNQYMKDPYIFTHMDFMVNLSNWIGGERDDRVYYAVALRRLRLPRIGFHRQIPARLGLRDGPFVRFHSRFAQQVPRMPGPGHRTGTQGLDAAQQQHALNPEFGNTESGRSLQCHDRSYVPFQPPWLQTGFALHRSGCDGLPGCRG